MRPMFQLAALTWMLVTLSVSAPTHVLSEPATGQESAPIRLDRNVVPVFQYVELHLDADQADYTGKVRIDVDVSEPTHTFRFHGRDLDMTSILLAGSSGRYELASVADEQGTVTVTSDTEIPIGRYHLLIEFGAAFGTQAVGLYRMEVEGRGYAFTQFEAIDGRRAFPMWDEPSFKHPYQLRLVVPAAHEAVTNTPVEKEETLEDGRRSILYARTPPLPSYLLAVATGPLESASIPGLKVPGRVYTVQGRAHLTTLAAEMTAPLLTELESFFGSDYPFAKLDFLAVPEFWPGAMENPGAITFAEPILCVDAEHASLSTRRRLAIVITHELSHQWYGDLVTMEWWDDLWLNEAFAYWMGETVADAVYPELRPWLETVRGKAFAMGADAQLTSHAIRQPVTDLANIMQAADGLTNHKGKTVIAMVRDWMGPETFQQGVQLYLERYAWSNAEGADLWNALSEVSGKDVGAVMETFLEQPGLPLVSAEVLEGGKLRLTQERFLHYGNEAPAVMWKIPVTFRYGVGDDVVTQRVFLDSREAVVTLDAGAAPEWLHLNSGEVGYYRWRVAPELLDRLSGDASAQLSVRERVAFVSHISALLDRGDVDGQHYLTHLGRFAQDEDPSVVDAMVSALNKVEGAFVEEELVESFATYVRATLRPPLDRFGMESREGEMEAISLVRPDLIGWLGNRGGDPEVLEHAEALAMLYLEDPSQVDPSMASTALRLAAIRGERALFDRYVEKFETTQIPAERGRYLAAIGSFRDPELVQAALDYNLSGPIRPQEVFTIPNWVGSYPPNAELPYEWLTENFDALTQRIPPMFVAYLPWAAAGCDSNLLARASAFFGEPVHQAPGTDVELAKVTAAVTSCVELREREGSSVREYLGRMQAELDYEVDDPCPLARVGYMMPS